MPLTKFPQDTDEPRLDVTLPVGTHVFKLTVIDDAGMRSEPDIVVVRVEARNPPDITNVAPDAARQGSTVSAAIYGSHLDKVTTIAVYHESIQDERIRTTIQPGGTAERLPVRLEILPHAPVGMRTLEVVTPDGVAAIHFSVLPETRPAIKDVLPASGPLGNMRPHAVTVRGENLREVKEVAFLLRGRPDTQLRAAVKEHTKDAVTVDLSISANAEFGSRQVQVTDPNSTASSPAEAGYRVAPGWLQILIIVLGIAAIVIHGLVVVAIRYDVFLLWPLPLLQIPVGLLLAILLAAMYLPIPGLAGARPWLRWLLIVLAVVNLYCWAANIAASRYGAPLFLVPALTEAALAILVFVESVRPHWKDRLPPATEAAAPVEEASAVAAAEADVAAHLKEFEATLGTSDLTNLREKVEFIEGVDTAHVMKLNQAGIVTVIDLLQLGATRNGRAELVESTGIDAGLILTWVNQADLFRIQGVGKQFGELLEAAGVDTVVELAQRKPANLFSKLTQVNAEKKLAGRSPRQDEVNTWVQQAKGLPRVVEY